MRDRIDTTPKDTLARLRDINADSGVDRRFKQNKKSYQIKTMNDRHHEIARMHACGYKNKEIASQLQITDMSVSQVLNSAVVKLKLDTIRGNRDAKTVEIVDKIDDMLPDAVKIFSNLIDGGDLKDDDTQHNALQLRAAERILGIGGYSPVKRTENRSISTTLTADDIKEIREDADKLGIASGDTVDCDYEILD